MYCVKLKSSIHAKSFGESGQTCPVELCEIFSLVCERKFAWYEGLIDRAATTSIQTNIYFTCNHPGLDLAARTKWL